MKRRNIYREFVEAMLGRFMYGSLSGNHDEKLKVNTKVQLMPDPHPFSDSFAIYKTNTYLGWISPDVVFLEFLDRFETKKEGCVELPWGLLIAACQKCEKDAEGFSEIIKKARNRKELTVLLGLEV